MPRSKTKIIPSTPEMWREVAGTFSCNDPGYTVAELMEMLGYSRYTIKYRILPKLIKEGKCVQGTGTRFTDNGRRYRASVYELKQ